jgi:hypothetical protein
LNSSIPLLVGSPEYRHSNDAAWIQTGFFFFFFFFLTTLARTNGWITASPFPPHIRRRTCGVAETGRNVLAEQGAGVF